MLIRAFCQALPVLHAKSTSQDSEVLSNCLWAGTMFCLCPVSSCHARMCCHVLCHTRLISATFDRAMICIVVMYQTMATLPSQHDVILTRSRCLRFCHSTSTSLLPACHIFCCSTAVCFIAEACDGAVDYILKHFSAVLVDLVNGPASAHHNATLPAIRTLGCIVSGTAEQTDVSCKWLRPFTHWPSSRYIRSLIQFVVLTRTLCRQSWNKAL